MKSKHLLTLTTLLLAAVAVACFAPGAIAQTEEGTAAAESGQEWQELKKGLRYLHIVVGDGREARRGKMVTVHYVGRLSDGTIFQSSRENNRSFVFRLGEGQVIQGWDRGMVGMKVGGVRRLQIPAKLGYGKRGIKGRIPKDADLDFEVELLAVTN